MIDVGSILALRRARDRDLRPWCGPRSAGIVAGMATDGGERLVEGSPGGTPGGIEHRVRVLVNGAPAADYAALRRIHPDIEWSFSVSALGFHGAIAQLIASETHPWVYLLNSDMRVDVDALAVVVVEEFQHVFDPGGPGQLVMAGVGHLAVGKIGAAPATRLQRVAQPVHGRNGAGAFAAADVQPQAREAKRGPQKRETRMCQVFLPAPPLARPLRHWSA